MVGQNWENKNPMPQQPIDPVTLAKQDYWRVRLDPSKRYLTHSSQRRVNDLTRMRLPDEHSAESQMQLPILTQSEARLIHGRKESAYSDYDQAHATDAVPTHVPRNPLG